MTDTKARGSIALARRLCVEIAGCPEDGNGYGSVEIAEILSAEVERLRKLSICECDDGFTEHDTGTCVNCVTAMRSPNAQNEADKKRIDFLESLRNRPIFLNKKNPAYFRPTDIHIRQASVMYARNLTSEVDFSGFGKSVREMIDDAINNQGNKE